MPAQTSRIVSSPTGSMMLSTDPLTTPPPVPRLHRIPLPVDVDHDSRSFKTNVLPRMLFLPDLGEGKERLQHCSSSSELPALRCRRQRRRLALEAARAAAPLRISLQPRMEPKNRYGASETPTAILSTISYASNLPYLDPDWANPQPLQQLSAKDEPSHCFASLSFRPTTSKRAPIFLAPRRRMTPNPSLVFFFSDRE